MLPATSRENGPTLCGAGQQVVGPDPEEENQMGREDSQLWTMIHAARRSRVGGGHVDGRGPCFVTWPT